MVSNCDHSEYVIYGDESGDPSIKTSCSEYPVFALAFCVFAKQEYIADVMKHMKGLKFFFWGHDMTILHSKKIRKQIDDFYFLQNWNLRDVFMSRLTAAIENSPFTVISTAVEKRSFRETHTDPIDLYDFCLERCLEKIYQFLQEKKQDGRLTYLVIESRMPEENRSLGQAFHRILEKNQDLQSLYPLKLIFADKKVNSIGLQLADLIAYPIGRHVLNPADKNLAFEIVEKKFFQYPDYLKMGLEVFSEASSATSEKQKTPDFSEV